MNFFTRLKGRVYETLVAYAEHPKGKWLLGVVSFAESSFFPIPPYFFMVPMLLAQRVPQWFILPLVASLASVLGGALGYGIGFFFYDALGAPLVTTYHLESELAVVKAAFDRNVFWAVFIAGFTPVPFKIITIAAGFFKVHFVAFFVAALISRPVRFFVASYAVKWFGRPAIELIIRESRIAILVLVVALLVFGFIILR